MTSHRTTHVPFIAALIFAIMAFILPVKMNATPTSAQTITCKRPLEPKFKRNIDGTWTARCGFTWRPNPMRDPRDDE